MMKETPINIKIIAPDGCKGCESCSVALIKALDTAPDAGVMQQVRIECTSFNPEDESAAVTVYAGYRGGEVIVEVPVVNKLEINCPQMNGTHPCGSAM